MVLHQGKVANEVHSKPEAPRVSPCRSSTKERPGENHDVLSSGVVA